MTSDRLATMMMVIQGSNLQSSDGARILHKVQILVQGWDATIWSRFIDAMTRNTWNKYHGSICCGDECWFCRQPKHQQAGKVHQHLLPDRPPPPRTPFPDQHVACMRLPRKFMYVHLCTPQISSFQPGTITSKPPTQLPHYWEVRKRYCWVGSTARAPVSEGVL